MANYRTIGGANLTELFPFTTAWAVLTTGTGRVTLDKKFTTAFTGHEKSFNLEATITHETFDSTITGLFDAYLQMVQPSTEYYEDGAATVNITASSDKTVLAIAYSSKNEESKRFVRVFTAAIQGGGFTMEQNKSIRTETKLTGVRTNNAITVGSALFNSSLLSAPATVTIAATQMGTSFWSTSV